jgi:hypothetical protein
MSHTRDRSQNAPQSASRGRPARNQAERDAAYRAVDAIKAADTDARLLTLEQAEVLVNWCGWHHCCSTFEDRNGKPFPLQVILDLYHASIVYATFDGWFVERRTEATKAYKAICRKHHIDCGAP